MKIKARTDKLHPARLLANALTAERRAREAPRGSYTRAALLTECRLWLFVARRHRGERKAIP